jgi:polyvinyl alcohol dehydrogenase (cytochrome)
MIQASALLAAHKMTLKSKTQMPASNCFTYLVASLTMTLSASNAFSQGVAANAQDAAHPGRAVYERACGACHNNPEGSRAPSLATLRNLNRSTVEYAINIGYMKIQAQGLKTDERTQMLDWLELGQADSKAWVAGAMCSSKVATINGTAKPIASTFGLGPLNLRQQTAAQSGLKTADFRKLELAWAIGFPQTPTMRSQPVIVGNTIYIATTDAGRVFALDTQSGCVKWTFQTPAPLRSSLSYGELEANKPVIVVGDAVGAVISIDAKTGKQLWRSDIRLHDSNRITGAPVIHKGRVYAPLSGVEISHTRDDRYECCKGQGAVVALDLKTGSKLWVGRTMEPATKQKLNRAGAQLWGPSGAPIWSTPAIDEKRNVLYVGTGENNSLPATETSDAIIAYDLDTG